MGGGHPEAVFGSEGGVTSERGNLEGDRSGVQTNSEGSGVLRDSHKHTKGDANHSFRENPGRGGHHGSGSPKERKKIVGKLERAKKKGGGGWDLINK